MTADYWTHEHRSGGLPVRVLVEDDGNITYEPCWTHQTRQLPAHAFHYLFRPIGETR